MSKRQRRQKRKAGNMPIRSSSHRKETVSKNHFERVISPWMVRHWGTLDYGIDATVEMTAPLETEDGEIVTGKRFSVQIKATSNLRMRKDKVVFRAQVGKIRYWYNSIEPVMLAVYDVSNETFYYLWVDDDLVSDLTHRRPKWVSQQSVGLQIPQTNELGEEALPILREYVLSWKRPSRFIIEPGTYFKIKEDIAQIIQSVISSTKDVDAPGVHEHLEDLHTSTNRAIYTISLTGPSRAGKSTLVNALVMKNISPIGILPTTGIPTGIVPGKKNTSEVLFHDGTTKEGPAKAEFLEQYVSQEKNPKNVKNVKFVTVKLVSDKLERGISFYDVPGLDDPDENVRSVTVTALQSVHAIIYVINAATMRDGGFALTKQIVEDLNWLGSRMDRLFLVFNKVDVLNGDQERVLREHVDEKLEEYGIKKFLPEPPFFLSAKEAFETRIGDTGSKKDSVTQLEEALWSYLLSQNKTGLYALMNILSDLRRNVDKVVTIINARLASAKDRKTLEKQIADVQMQLPELGKEVDSWRNEVIWSLSDSIEENLKSILAYLERKLRTIPSDEALPSTKTIRRFLEQKAISVLSDLEKELRTELGNVQVLVDNWIESTLSQVRMTVEDRTLQSPLKVPSIGELDIPIPEDLSGALGLTAIAGLGGLLFGPIGLIIGGLLGFFAGLLLTEEQRRGKRITDILKRARQGYRKIQSQSTKAIKHQIDDSAEWMVDVALDRANVFLGSVSRQIEKLGKPLTEKEKKGLERASKGLSPIEGKIQSYSSRLQEFTS